MFNPNTPQSPGCRRGGPRGRRPVRGFTLLEALIAGMILALSTLAITGSVNASVRAAARARDTQRVAALIDELMTKVDLIGPDRLLREGPTEGAFEGADARFSWRVEILPLIDHYLYEVNATVTWIERGRQRSALVSTRLDDPSGSRNPYLRWDDL